MSKTFSIALRETRDRIVETLNSSGLPIDALDMLLGQIQTVVHSQAEQEYLRAKESEENGSAES